MSTHGCLSSWRCKKHLQLDLKKVNAKSTPVSKSKVQPFTGGWTDCVTKGPFYATAMRKGKRAEMEDCCKTLYLPQSGQLLACFGVFDGHAGVTAAQFASDYLLTSISQYDELGVTQAFLDIDQRLLLNARLSRSNAGTTALVAVLNGDQVIVANAGDSRALLVSDGSCTQVSYDHIAADPSEQQRVESVGGYIFQVSGAMRVQGAIAVTRGLGSPNYKQYVIPDPHVTSFCLSPQDQFLLLATDGLYMRLSNEELRDLLLENQYLPIDELAHQLTELALSRGSPDNISLTLIDLRALSSLSSLKPAMQIDTDETMAEEPTQVPLSTPRNGGAKKFF